MAKTLTLQYTPGKRGSDGRITGLLVDCAGTERVCLDRPATQETIDYIRGFVTTAREMGVTVDDAAIGKLTKARAR